jgi:16S rRNA (cytosine1402-N4)-methyltransferase
MSDQPATDEHTLGYHVPVLLKESVEGLSIKPGGVYVDCTFGGGGHSRAILQHLGSEGKLFVFDQDADAQKNVPADDRIVFIHQNFRHLSRFLRLHGCTAVDGILADLGVSSHQFDQADRGFSIRFDASLDMRMDVRQTTTAADLINHMTERELHLTFEKYGEVTNSKSLARCIVNKRTTSPVKTIEQFKSMIHDEVKGNPQKYMAKVFQALRIAVNEELEALNELLHQAVAVLKPGGILAIITFHSLEDRIVKQFIKEGDKSTSQPDEIYGIKIQSPLKAIHKKPVVASEEEQQKNTRSRSAKLRVAEKVK